MHPIFIDVREPSEFAEGHVTNAINLSLSKIIENERLPSSISKDAHIVLYCRSGNRSGIAKNILEKNGYTHIVNGINKDYVEKTFKN